MFYSLAVILLLDSDREFIPRCARGFKRRTKVATVVSGPPEIIRRGSWLRLRDVKFNIEAHLGRQRAEFPS